ncbi:hypothetical protein K7H94_15750 [Pantoea dispersa]|uniref:hypothetical protein n=1 Tax=Pantoea dispersa TaxID=59814 RepID=UPI001CA67E73|nr:hypothetical protein [Pantoea dispersa]QZY89841.1 hypothetical protein K7H94_15750 [Pantoea dispersa]
MDKKKFIELHQLCEKIRTYMNNFKSPGVGGAPDFKLMKSIIPPFYKEGHIKSDVIDKVDIAKQSEFIDALNTIATLSFWTNGSSSQSNQNRAAYRAIDLIVITLEEIIENLPKDKPLKIFYSWQSSTEKSLNNHFIKSALRDALKEMNKELPIEERDSYEGEKTYQLDHDTNGVSGAPDIFNTICEKIDSCSIFIADVSLIANGYCNSNVMLELGYAFKALGDSRIILVMNESLGDKSKLPFDLHTKRLTLYELSEGEDKKEIKKTSKTLLKSPSKVSLIKVNVMINPYVPSHLNT